MSTITVLDVSSVCRTLIVVFCCIVAVVRSENIFVNNESFEIVHTQSGTVRGRESVSLFDGRVYYSFLGIPYARPPINELRFKPPQRPEPWKNIRDAFEYGSVCVQTDDQSNQTNGNEDCLFINVFVPKTATSDKKLPVMLFIYGGGYISGAADPYGPDFLINNDVILVTFNYRVGPFGFLSLGTPDYSGNMGLKDQLLAIRWVNENIEQFGGDKTSITLFGESAGASSTHFHVISSASRGLFQRAIIQSGSVLSQWAYSIQNNHLERLKEIANDKDALKQYLLSEDALVLSKKLSNPFFVSGASRVVCDFVWAPVIEAADSLEPFITERPENILRQASDKNLDIMFGFTDNENYIFTAAEFQNPSLLENFDASFELQFPLKHLRYDYNSPDYRQMADEVRQFYFPDGIKVTESVQKYCDLFSDVWFVYGVDQSAKLEHKRSTGKTYLYKFSLDNKLNLAKKMAGVEHLPGASHGDDIFYVFRMDGSIFGLEGDIYENLTSHSVEVDAIRMVTRLWTNFAKYGDPTPTDAIDFLPIDNNVINYAHLTNDGLVPGTDPSAESINFWDNLYVKYASVFHQEIVPTNDEDGIVIEDAEHLDIDKEGLIAAEELKVAQEKLDKIAKRKANEKLNKKLKQKPVKETFEAKVDQKMAEKLNKKVKKPKQKASEQVVDETATIEEQVVEKVNKKTNKKQKSSEQIVEEKVVDPKAAEKLSKKGKKSKQPVSEQVVDETVTTEEQVVEKVSKKTNKKQKSGEQVVDSKAADKKLNQKGKKSKQPASEQVIDEAAATEEQVVEKVSKKSNKKQKSAEQIDPKAAEKGKKSKQGADQTGELNENVSKKPSKKSGKKSKEQVSAGEESANGEQSVEKSGKKSKANKKSSTEEAVNESTSTNNQKSTETKSSSKKSSKAEKGGKKSGKSKSSNKKGGAKEEL